jgi:hypothetical protein
MSGVGLLFLAASEIKKEEKQCPKKICTLLKTPSTAKPSGTPAPTSWHRL